MPRGNDLQQNNDATVKALIIGDGKCGKSDWAARAVEGGFNVLYLDGDVGTQTIAGLTKDKKDPVPAARLDQLFLIPIHDQLSSGGLGHEMSDFFLDFITTKKPLLWNDSKARLFSRITDGDETSDSIWQINPFKLDATWVLVIDSWTSLAQSAAQWAARDLGIKLEEIDDDGRKSMRDLYRIVGEKLTQYLVTIRSLPCHVICIAHPNEFVKTEKPNNTTVKAAKEGDYKILWTKMIPKSITNNHAFTMSKYFTDIAWLEVGAMGDFKIDYRASNDRMSGSHLNAVLPSRGEGSFVSLVKQLGGAIPSSPSDFTQVIQIHDGYTVPGSKPRALGLDGAAPALSGRGLNLNLGTKGTS